MSSSISALSPLFAAAFSRCALESITALKISSTVIRFEAWSTPLDVRSFKAAERRFSVKIKGFDAVSLNIEEMRMRGGGIGAGSGKIFALRQQCLFYKF